jgi:hypothetical protein
LVLAAENNRVGCWVTILNRHFSLAFFGQCLASSEFVGQNKISISAEEIAGVSLPPPSQIPEPPSLGAAIPFIAKIALALVALALPILCVLAGAIRIYIRNKEPRVQHAWTRYLCSLLIASGLLTTAVVVFSLLWLRSPLTPLSFDSHVLDTVTAFPDVQQPKTHTVEELANSFKKTVFIVAQQPKWNRLSRENLSAAGFGSGVLVFAGHDGYLVLSSRHVIVASIGNSRDHFRAT